MIQGKEIKEIDTQNMFDVLKNFPIQVEHAIEIGKSAPVFSQPPVSGDYMILGMGGSAISGDLLASFFAATTEGRKLLIRTNRGYNLPGSINENTNIIASSYSGNTEETLSGLIDAMKITKRIVCITTGGKLEEIAKENSLPVIKIPGGLQPRAALGYSFFPMLYLLIKSNAFLAGIKIPVSEILEMLNKRAGQYSYSESYSNFALKLAEQLKNTVPVIYSSHERLDSVNVRWRGQIQENAKQLAFGSFLPEMNHNEINAYSYPKDIALRTSVIYLRDNEDNPRIKTRFAALRSAIENSVKQVIELSGEGENLLTRMFDLLYLADWVSFYLAMLNGVDPTPIPLINVLKNELAKG